MHQKHTAARAARVAYHEAGHTAMRLEFGHRFRLVTIVPDPVDGSGGALHNRPIGAWFRPDIEITGRVELRMQREIMCDLAGVLAEQMFTGKRANHVGAGSDYRAATDAALRLCGFDEESSAVVRWLRLRTKKVLQRRWEWRVKPIAEALIVRQTLTEAEVRGVLQEAMAPFLAECEAKTAKLVIAQSDLR